MKMYHDIKLNTLETTPKSLESGLATPEMVMAILHAEAAAKAAQAAADAAKPAYVSVFDM